MTRRSTLTRPATKTPMSAFMTIPEDLAVTEDVAVLEAAGIEDDVEPEVVPEELPGLLFANPTLAPSQSKTTKNCSIMSLPHKGTSPSLIPSNEEHVPLPLLTGPPLSLSPGTIAF